MVDLENNDLTARKLIVREYDDNDMPFLTIGEILSRGITPRVTLNDDSPIQLDLTKPLYEIKYTTLNADNFRGNVKVEFELPKWKKEDGKLYREEDIMFYLAKGGHIELLVGPEKNGVHIECNPDWGKKMLIIPSLTEEKMEPYPGNIDSVTDPTDSNQPKYHKVTRELIPTQAVDMPDSLVLKFNWIGSKESLFYGDVEVRSEHSDVLATQDGQIAAMFSKSFGIWMPPNETISQQSFKKIRFTGSTVLDDYTSIRCSERAKLATEQGINYGGLMK